MPFACAKKGASNFLNQPMKLPDEIPKIEDLLERYRNSELKSKLNSLESKRGIIDNQIKTKPKKVDSLNLETRFLTTKEVCGYLKCSKKTLENYVKQNLLKPFQLKKRGMVRWPIEQIERFSE